MRNSRTHLPRSFFATAAVTAVILFSSSAHATAVEKTFQPHAIDAIDLDLPFADAIKLVASDGPVSLRIDAGDDADCQPEVTQDGTTLKVRLPHAHVHHADDCDLEVRVAAPADARIELELGAGNVRLDGIAARLDLSVGAGNVTGKVGRQPVKIETGAGNIEVSFAAAPAGQITAETGAGNVKLHLPAGTTADVHASTGIGSVRQELASDADAITKIEADTGVGSVYVGT